MQNRSYQVPQLQISDQFGDKSKTIILSTGKTVKVSDLQFTILNQKNVYRDIQELAEIYFITRDLPKNLAAFKPERLVLHEVIANVMTKIRVEDDDENSFKRIVDFVYKSLTHEIKSLSKSLNSIRDELEQEVNILVKAALDNGELLDYQGKFSTYLPEIQTCFDKIIKEKDIKGKECGKYKSGFTFNDVMTARIVDIIYNKIAEEKINPLVEKHIDKVLPQQKIPTTSTTGDMLLLMVAGGQASGKGTSVKILKESVERISMSWENFAKFNTDAIKSLMLTNEKVEAEFFSQLTQDEASLVNMKAQTIVKKRAQQHNAPNIFFDQVYVGQDQLNIVKANGGKAKVIIVSTEIVDAIERSYKRGENIGRFEHTINILLAHRNMTNQLPDRLQENDGQDFEIRIVDNNVKQGEQPAVVADINCKTGSIFIYDKTKLERFIAKIAINIKASCKEELYNLGELAQATVDNYFQRTGYIVYDYSSPQAKQLNRAVNQVKLATNKLMATASSLFPQPKQPSVVDSTPLVTYGKKI